MKRSVTIPAAMERRSSLKISATRFIRNKKGPITEEYSIGALVGVGTYGDVFECCHRQSGDKRAIKAIPKSLEPSENANVVNEFNILKNLDHPNILKLYELFEDDENFYIVSDIYLGGELFDRIQEKGNLRESDAAVLMLNLLSCINYCHKNNVVHKDLKPENILLADDSLKLNDLKVIDFGISQDVSQSKRSFDELVGSPGSLCYMAPETLSGFVSPKSDIWACGVIAFVIMGGYLPFHGTEDEVMEQILDGRIEFEYPIWDAVTDEAKDFIEYLLDSDPERRPSASEALSHPWLVQEREHACQLSSWDDTILSFAQESLENIQDFHASSKLKQATCAIIASQLLTKADRQQIDEVFRAIDQDCDGFLDRTELAEAFKTYKGTDLTPEELDDIFSRVDMDETGSIDYSEFVIASVVKQKLLDETTLKKAFEMFDSDRSGFLDADELRSALDLGSTWDDYILEKVIKQVDDDGDGTISFEEFKEAMDFSCRTACTMDTSGKDIDLDSLCAFAS